MATDFHAHLFYIDDVEDVIRRSVNEGVTLILTNGVDVESSEACVRLAGEHESVRAAVGIHPCYVDTATREAVERIRTLAKRASAIGEVGLDYKCSGERDAQLSLFREMIGIAEEERLPVIVHSRAAQKEVIDVLADVTAPVVLHWFSGGMELVSEGVDRGYYFTFGPSVLKYSAYDAVIDTVPLEQTLLETDTPVRFSGEEARPWWVLRVAEKIASVKKEDVSTVLEVTDRNAEKLLR